MMRSRCWIPKLDRPFHAALGGVGLPPAAGTVGPLSSGLWPLVGGDRPFETSPPLSPAHAWYLFADIVRCPALRDVLRSITDRRHLCLPVRRGWMLFKLKSIGRGAASANHVCSVKTQLWSHWTLNQHFLNLFICMYLPYSPYLLLIWRTKFLTLASAGIYKKNFDY